MREFHRINRLPPYTLGIVNELKHQARCRGEDIIDFGLGNPDQTTPKHIVDKLCEAATKAGNHRYSLSRGIYKLRLAITDWYKRRFDVDLDPETEAIATIGSKEGIAHLALAITAPGDSVLVPTPTYPIHTYAFILANGDVIHVPMGKDVDFFEALLDTFKRNWPRPKAIIINFPHNPTTHVVEIDFFEKIVEFAKEHDLIVIHDFAYADMVFDGYKAPSFLQVPGAKDVGVEFHSLSKTFNMTGWRIAFIVGNELVVKGLAHVKDNIDSGQFAAIQKAGIHALENPDITQKILEKYRRRLTLLVDALNSVGFDAAMSGGSFFLYVEAPKGIRGGQRFETGEDFSQFLIKEMLISTVPWDDVGRFTRFSATFTAKDPKEETRIVAEIKKRLSSVEFEF